MKVERPLEIVRVIRRIPAETYGYYEVELKEYKTIEEIEEDAKNQQHPDRLL